MDKQLLIEMLNKRIDAIEASVRLLEVSGRKEAGPLMSKLYSERESYSQMLRRLLLTMPELRGRQ